MSHISREQSIWNQLLFGRNRIPADATEPIREDDHKTALQETVSEKEVWVDEKKSYSDDSSEEIFSFPLDRKSRFMHSKGKRIFWRHVIGIFCVIAYVFYLARPEMRAVVALPSLLQDRFRSYIDSKSAPAHCNEREEIIAVSYPYIPKASYGKPVHSEVLIDHVFDSWGNPSLKTFVPPENVTFNKVVLTLNISVSGVQYDRLAHLYVGGAEIWRTSTIEPRGGRVFSSFKKDVSQYVSLFQPGAPILMQLDNLILDGLDGKFHVKLQADFFSSASFHSIEEPTKENEKYQYFDIRKDADHVYPLNKKSCKKQGPIAYIPSEKFSVTLPQVPQNTTRLKLAIFASGNGDEEFWYSNLLDRYQHKFEDDGIWTFGHGPLRFVSVWVDGKKIAVQLPQPFLFTGAYSPSLWAPVVATDTFDLSSIDIDVSPLLPLLWKLGDHVIEIKVDNGVDDFEGESSGIGNDWIISANLLAYENSNVKSATGEILSLEASQKGDSTGVSLPYVKTLEQVVSGKYVVDFVSLITLELHDGQSLNTTVIVSTKANSNNVQSYTNSGYNGNIVHVGDSDKYFQLIDNSDDSDIHTTLVRTTFPLVFSFKEKMTRAGLESFYDFVVAKAIHLTIDDKKIMDETSSSEYTVGDKDGEDSSRSKIKYKSVVDGPTKKSFYERKVKTKNGKILYDTITEEN